MVEGRRARSRAKKVPVKNRHVPDHRRILATMAAGLLLVATTLLTGATPAAAAPPATVTGQACAPGTGVTVAVDFAPGTDEVQIGCAIGTQTTMAAAGAAAGFTFTPTTGFLASVNGVAPADPNIGFWSIFINTTDGQPAGPLGTAWSFAQTGIDGGPLAVDTVLLFDLVEDFNAPTEDPRITLAEIAATAPAAPVAAAAPASVTGQACLPGQGVTVAVDFAPDADEVVIGCAIGTQTTMAAAGAAAGFTFAPTTGFLTTVNGVTAPAIGFWSIFINTTDGQPAGPLGTTLTFAQTGIDGGPLAVDTVLLFDLVPDFNAPQEDARVTLAELGATAPDSDAVEPPSYSPTGDGDALAAAGWIGRQLQASGGVLQPGGTADFGLTMDAMFALAAAGVGGSEIKNAANALYDSGSGYLGAASDAAANAGKIAKTTLALQVAGFDPTVFPDGAGGTRNLPAELRLSMSADGQIGPNDFPLVHALAVLALVRTTGGAPAAAVSWLQGTQCTTAGDSFGAYGYSGCGDVDVDGTSLATQALLAAGVDAGDPSVADANGWLTGLQQPDGGLPSSFGSANTNGTGLAGQTFLALGEDAAAGSAAGYVGGLQVSCASLVDGSKLTVADVGAIAYDPTGFQDGNEFGIDTVSADQWVRASTQGILSLGLPAFDAITAAGADPDLPAAAYCAPVTTPPSTTPSTTAAAVVVTTSAGPQLSATGVTTATLPMTITGLAALLMGVGLVLLGRRTRGRHGN